MSNRRVLFLCRHNAGRSQIAEALLKARAGDRFDVFSAGPEPVSELDPYAIRAMREVGIDTKGMYTKSTDTLMGEHFDFVIVLCDSMNEMCPSFPGEPVYAYWYSPSLTEYAGTEAAKIAVARKLLNEIARRINRFLQIPLDTIDPQELEYRLKSIPEMD